MNIVFILIVEIAYIVSLSAQEVSETVHAVAGHSAELPCNVTAKNQDDELLVVAWYRAGSNTAFYSYDRREGKRAAAPGGRYQLEGPEAEPRLVIQRVAPGDKGAYQCSVEFARSPSRNTDVLLNVIEPPQRLWVGLQKNASRVASAGAGANTSGNIGPYYVGDSVELFCVAFGGNPQASLSWWSGKRLLENMTTVLSPQRVRSDVTYAPLRREDHGLVLTCLGNNNDVTPPLAIDIVIDMKLPLELIAVRSLAAEAGRVRADDTLALQCRVLGARPTPPIIWRVGDNTLLNLEADVTEEPSQRLLVSEIELTIDHTWDEARVTCCVPAYRPAPDADYTCAPPLPLTVFYPPVLNVIVQGGILEPENCTVRAIKGSNVTLNCTHQANPPTYQLIWFYEDDIITDYEGSNDTNYQPVLELRGVTEKDKGVYVCGAINVEGSTHSDPIYLDVTYPAYCEDETVAEYGLGVDESINITCKVKANPAPLKYGWVVMNEVAKADIFKNKIPEDVIETDNSTMLYTRPNDTAFSSIFCWGINEVAGDGLPVIPCGFLVTDQTAPRPPAACLAVRSGRDVTVTCEKGHDGGLPQRFTIVAKSTDTGEVLETITKLEPKFLLQDLTQENFKLEIVATNDKGDSKLVEMDKDSVVDELPGEAPVQNTVANITTLALALFGGVLLVALAACGLVLCAHERGSRPPKPNPPLCAYNTEESNCNDSDDSECNVRRTESFRRAMTRYPSKNFDVRRTSSFHSARYLHDVADQDGSHKHNDLLRHSPSCRVHSMQNINRRRDMDNLCDHLATHLPPNVNYVPITTSTFHTMPKKMRNKMSREISDEASVVTTSDGFSLPPPPDEFGTYRSGTKIKDMPKTPTYTTIVRKNSNKKESQRQQYGTITSPMNTVGIPTVSGAPGVYSYPDDDGRQVLLRTPGVLTTFQTFSSPKESGI